MAENQQTWDKDQAENARTDDENRDQEAERRKAEPQVQAQHAPQHPPQLQAQHQAQLQQLPPHLHLHTLQALQGHAPLSAADIAAIQQQHNALLLQAQQAQQDYENEQRDKGAALQLGQAEALGIHALAQQGAIEGQQVQHHDADYERERKEKRKVANREAARRMRQRRAAQVSSLSVSNTDLKGENTALQQQMAHLANHNRELMTENAGLRQEILNLKQTLENNRAAVHAATSAAQQQNAAS